MKTLIIVPAYNEAQSIGSLLRELKKEGTWDILVVNDASTDNTEDVVRASGVSWISLPVNLGIGGAVQTGFRYARDNRYQIAVQVDGDGQHDPRQIHILTRPILLDQADAVVGSRFVQKTDFRTILHRRMGIRFLQFLSHLLTGHAVTDSTSGFRAYNEKAFSYLADRYAVDYPEPEAIISLFKKRFRILEIPVAMRRREAGRSSISGGKSIYYLFKVVVSMVFEFIRSRHE